MAVLDKRETKDLTLGRRFKLASKFFRPDGPRFNIKALCQALTLTRKEFEAYSGTSANHYWEDKFVKLNDGDPRKKAERLLLLVVLLEDLFPEELDGQFWLRLPNTTFDKKPPLELCIEGRIDEVIDLLNSLAEGNTVA
jgi:uncharacterized protein (DUF2384 family)